MVEILEDRKTQVFKKGISNGEVACGRRSTAGSVSQRACVFCGSRVVLYPIADALHLVHGPVGCAAYTWDIRGALSSGPELHRNSFSTDLREPDVIYGGEKKLEAALEILIERYTPKAAFVYSTCIVGVIGDDIQAVCKRVGAKTRIPVIPVFSEGFKGTKKDGYRAACEALFQLVEGGAEEPGLKSVPRFSINLLGEFNIGGETWIIRDYYQRMGIHVLSCMTGDGRVEDIQRAHLGHLNLVQCSGSMLHLAKLFETRYGIPFQRVSYFGLDDTANALYAAAAFFGDEAMMERTRQLVRDEIATVMPQILAYREALRGKRAAIYVGGAFKAISLIRALGMLGMKTVLVGSQTGNKDDYEVIKGMCDDDAVIVDDSNPAELAHFVQEQKVDLFIGGVKERPIAFKLGVGFCDHNHERKEALAGFVGMVNFAKEVHASVTSPIWGLIRSTRERSI